MVLTTFISGSHMLIIPFHPSAWPLEASSHNLSLRSGCHLEKCSYIVHRASHKRMTPIARLGRVLMAEHQVLSGVIRVSDGFLPIMGSFKTVRWWNEDRKVGGCNDEVFLSFSRFPVFFSSSKAILSPYETVKTATYTNLRLETRYCILEETKDSEDTIMAKVSQVKDYMSLEEIRVRIRTTKDPDQQMRWQIIYTVAADPRVATIVATQLGGSKWLVSSAVAQYNRFGQKAFCGPGRGRHRSQFHRSYNRIFGKRAKPVPIRL